MLLRNHPCLSMFRPLVSSHLSIICRIRSRVKETIRRMLQDRRQVRGKLGRIELLQESTKRRAAYRCLHRIHIQNIDLDRIRTLFLFNYSIFLGLDET